MAKRGSTHSAAQRTTGTFLHLISKAFLLPSRLVHSVHLFVISTSSFHLFFHWDGEERGGKGRTQGDCSATADQNPLPWANRHSPLPCLTNVPWHSYITRKLAKWINHGPCLALRALNGFSPLQACPIIAFIHLVEARFTHSQKIAPIPGCVFRSGGKSTRDLSSDHNRYLKQQLVWRLRRVCQCLPPLGTGPQSNEAISSSVFTALLLSFPCVCVINWAQEYFLSIIQACRLRRQTSTVRSSGHQRFTVWLFTNTTFRWRAEAELWTPASGGGGHLVHLWMFEQKCIRHRGGAKGQFSYVNMQPLPSLISSRPAMRQATV